MITTDRIQQLHDKYLDLIRLEIVEFGVKATEVRHLIGRLGEFHCALQVGGVLAHKSNQHGFDVVCANGRRISVKTTAQISGFVPISKSTVDRVDDLMVVQFCDGELTTLYFGPVKPAVAVSRYYENVGNYELDLSKARRLMASQAAQSEKLLIAFEGGTVHTIERNGSFFLLINQVALLDMLDEEDREGIDGIKELEFPSAPARDEYIRERGWDSENLDTTRPWECPQCSSPRVATILFGMPSYTARLAQDLAEETVVLGGCAVTEDDLTWECVACKYRW